MKHPKLKTTLGLILREQQKIKELKSKEKWDDRKAQFHPPPQTFVFQGFFIFYRSGGKKPDKMTATQPGDKDVCRRKEPRVIRETFRSDQGYFTFSHHGLPGGLCALEMSAALPRVTSPGKVSLALHQKVPFAFYSSITWRSLIDNGWCFITWIWQWSLFQVEFYSPLSLVELLPSLLQLDSITFSPKQWWKWTLGNSVKSFLLISGHWKRKRNFLPSEDTARKICNAGNI